MRHAFSLWLQGRWYSGKPPLLLLPLSALFGAVTALRRRLIRPVRLPVRVVVIGNLAVGGSGKTPLVAWLARELRQRNVKVGIVTRGYGREEHGIRRVEAGTSATAVGDEPRWLADVTGEPVMVGADRVAAVRALLADTPIDIVLSDDGLQHYRLARDVEIVAVDARRGLGNGALLPAGPLREPPSRLTRADAVVLKGSDEVALPDLPTVVRMNYRLGAAESLRDGATRPLAEFRGQPVHALAAIGDPESFFRALEAECLNVERIPLADHAPIAATVARLPTDRHLLMTAKDAARLAAPPEHAWQVPLEVAFSQDDATTLLRIVLGDTLDTE
ncbi:MAG: tetraacyldisaccharide 4'-kinase [Gammaproteobacteria bacterium]